MEERLEEEVRVQREAMQKLELQLSEMRQQFIVVQERLEGAEADKQRALKELSERLTHSYKTELEGLRSRFRLMATTSMERSPSDSSLEKIEVCATHYENYLPSLLLVANFCHAVKVYMPFS